jgi:hypothetical protein
MSPLEIIAPVFAMMGLGYGAGKTKFFPPEAVSALMRFVWYVAIPALMFRLIANATVPGAEELILAAGYYLGIFTVYFGTVFIVGHFLKLPMGERGVMALAVCFGNGGFIGIPVIEGVFGAEGLRLLLILITFHSMTLVPITTIIIESGSANGGSPMGIMKKTANGLIHNPLLIALFSGLAFAASGLPMPDVVDRFLAMPAATAAPCGLFAAGATLSRVKIAGDLPQAFLVVFLKTMIVPVAVFLSTTYIFGLPPLWVGTATLMAGLPTGMVAYSVAEQYATAPRRAATAVLVATLVSIVTLSGLIYLVTTNN